MYEGRGLWRAGSGGCGRVERRSVLANKRGWLSLDDWNRKKKLRRPGSERHVVERLARRRNMQTHHLDAKSRPLSAQSRTAVLSATAMSA